MEPKLIKFEQLEIVTFYDIISKRSRVRMLNVITNTIVLKCIGWQLFVPF